MERHSLMQDLDAADKAHKAKAAAVKHARERRRASVAAALAGAFVVVGLSVYFTRPEPLAIPSDATANAANTAGSAGHNSGPGGTGGGGFPEPLVNGKPPQHPNRPMAGAGAAHH